MKRIDLPLLAAAGSGALLLGALYFQYGMGLAPCQMCYWQRWPHLAALTLGAVFWLLPSKLLVWLGAAAAATSGVIGLYHSGVEQGIFQGPTACSGGGGLLGQNIDDLMNFDQITRIVRCDEIPWELLGLSMASWNAVASFALAGLWLAALRR